MRLYLISFLICIFTFFLFAETVKKSKKVGMPHPKHAKNYTLISKSNLLKNLYKKDSLFLAEEGSIILLIHGVVCSFCAEAAKKSLLTLSQIDEKTINIDSKEKTIRFSLHNNQRLDLEQARKILLKRGYQLRYALVFGKVKIEKIKNKKALSSFYFKQKMHVPTLLKKYIPSLSKEVSLKILVDLKNSKTNKSGEFVAEVLE